MHRARPSLIGRWRRLSAARRLLLAEAVAALAAASAAIRWLPFKRAIRLGSRRLSGAPERPAADLAEIRWSIEAAARAAPWRAVCFQQGLALQWMARRRGVDAQLHYGIGKDENGELLAHVWVADGEAIIIGGEGAEQVRRVATYP